MKRLVLALVLALVLVATVAVVRALQSASRQPQVAPVRAEPLD